MRLLPRREHIDRLLSGSAGIVAASALAVSAYQAKLSREQQRMSVWPYVTQDNTGADTNYARRFHNVGLGPALVRSMQLTLDGRPVSSWPVLLERGLQLRETQLDSVFRHYNRVTTSSIRRGSVLLPGATLELVRIQGPFGVTLRRLLNSERVHLVVCYCSLYGECWLSDSHESEAEPVRECAYEGRAAFRS